MKTVWSVSMNCMKVSGFTTVNKKGIKRHWSWNEEDMVYYWDDVDDCWYEEIPESAILDI